MNYHFQFSEREYTKSSTDNVRFFFREPLLFQFGGDYTPPLFSQLIFEFTGDVVTPDEPTNSIRNNYRHMYNKADTVDSQTSDNYGVAKAINVGTSLQWGESEVITSSYLLHIRLKMISNDKHHLVNHDVFNLISKAYYIPFVRNFLTIDKAYKITTGRFSEYIGGEHTFKYAIPVSKDTQSVLKYSHVDLNGHARAYDLIRPPRDTSRINFDFNRVPKHAVGAKEALSFDLNIDPNDIVEIGMSWDSLIFDFSSVPVYIVGGKEAMIFDFSIDENLPLKTGEGVKVYINGVIQPTGSQFGLVTGGLYPPIDQQTSLRHEALKELIIGTGNKLRSGKDDDVNPPPPVVKEPVIHIPYEVYQIMNTVNIKDVLTNTIIDFDDFSMTRDIDSFVWTFNFTIKTEASVLLVKPVGRVLKSVIININGVDIRAFVGKTSKSRNVNKDSGVVTVVNKCNAWSELRKLGDPYSRKASNTTDVLSSSSQLVTDELLGTGHTVEWETTLWNVPAGIHSYQNKTPIGAILSVVNAIGGVIVPHLSDMSFKVRPRFPVSPWDWDNVGTIPDRIMSESQFYSIDNESVPKDNPDSVYVFGNDAGVHCTRFGKNGSAPLPDIVDKYISTSEAGQERGRNEVAKNSFLESIPMTTYVDNNGLIMPQELLEITNTSNSDVWRGMVLSTTIRCSRIGTAITQTINVVRFHEDD